MNKKAAVVIKWRPRNSNLARSLSKQGGREFRGSGLALRFTGIDERNVSVKPPLLFLNGIFIRIAIERAAFFCIENSYSFDETSLFRLCIPRSTRWKRHARGEVRRERESTWLLGKQSR